MTKGWYRESERHARAARGERTVKDNPGRVMAHSSKSSKVQEAMSGQPLSPRLQKEVKEDPSLKTKTFKQIQKKGVFLKFQGDADKDGVVNVKDCEPLNKDKQGTIHEQREKDIGAANEEIEKFKDNQDKPLFEKRAREIGEERGKEAKSILKELREEGHKGVILKDVEEAQKEVETEKTDTSTFGKVEELKFKAKRAIPFVKTEPSEEAKELRTLRARQIKREGDKLRRDEIRELESIEELDPLEEKNLELKKEVKEIRLEDENKRLEAEIAKRRPSIFGKAAKAGKGVLSEILD